MHFHFNLRNLPPIHRFGTQDLVEGIRAGLEDCGHFVTFDDRDFLDRPAVNLILEHFNEETAAQLREIKSAADGRMVLGIIATEDLHDPLIMANEFQWRRDAFLMAMDAADFVWTVLPNIDDYRTFSTTENVFRFEWGYSDRLVNVPLAPFRDIDVFLPGHLYPYRQRVVEDLESQGLRVRATNYQMPIHIYRSLAGRSKVILDVPREPGLRFLSYSRLALGLNNAIAVVSECFDESPLSMYYDYTVRARRDDLVETCLRTVREQDAVALGRAAFERYRAEKPMAKMVERLLDHPLFDEIGG
jgi:hypothetical protein